MLEERKMNILLYRKIFPYAPASKKVGPFIPRLKDLILTHIFLGLLMGRIDTVEAVKLSATVSLFWSPFTKSICKMWVKDRLERRGLSGPFVVIMNPRGMLRCCVPLQSSQKAAEH